MAPILIPLPPAPELFMNFIFCNCMKERGSNCESRKLGMQCSTNCGFYGHLCANVAFDDARAESIEV